MRAIVKYLKENPGPAVFLAAAAACLPLLTLPFVFDDGMSVRDNIFLRDLSSLKYLFSPAYEQVFRNESFEPLTYVLLMAAGRLFGWQPWGMHLFSALAHAACAWSVYRLALSLFGRRKPAVLAGLFFALHPAQSGSLIAVLFTGTIFSALFFFWALDRFLSERGRSRPAAALLTGLLFGVSLLFKERAFPGLLLFWLLPLLRGDRLQELRRRLPELLSLSVFWLAALLSRLPAGRGSAMGFDHTEPSLIFSRLAAYAKMLVLPFWLSPAYQKGGLLPDVPGLAALAAAAAVFLYALGRQRREERGASPAVLGALAGGLLLLPYLNLLPFSDLAEYLSSAFVSDRYLYLPMLGASLIFAAAAARLEERLPRSPAASAWPAALFAVFLLLSAGRQLSWRSEEAVWNRAVRINPESSWANYMLGSYYLQEGSPGRAAPLLERTLALGPSRGVRSHALGALAGAALMDGRPVDAKKLARSALETWDANYDAWNTYGAALASLGRKKDAARALEVAASAYTTGDAPLVNLGKVYLELGKPADAVLALERALQRSRSAATLDLLCSAHEAVGSLERAAAACLACVELEPGRPEALLKLAGIYRALGMNKPAALCIAEAEKLSPGVSAGALKKQ